LPAILRNVTVTVTGRGTQRRRRIGTGNLGAIQDHKLQLVELGLLAADLLEADLLCDLAGEDDLLRRVLLGGRVGGILEMQRREKVLACIGRARRPDEGCGRGGFGFACCRFIQSLVLKK
jgi:hypothetical protein